MSVALASRNITASTADEAGLLLDLVVEEFQQLARRDPGCGILVTRKGPGRFTVELSEQVPYGVTWEAGR